MSIQEHLRPDEQVKMHYRHDYATDRRIIKHREGTFSEEMIDLDYDHITSIEVKRKTQWLIVLNGLLFLGLGTYIGVDAFDKHMAPVMTLMWSGVFLTVFGLLYRTGYYHARGAGGENMAICKHKYIKGLWESQKKEADEFVHVIRKLKKRRLNVTDNDMPVHPNTTQIDTAVTAPTQPAEDRGQEAAEDMDTDTTDADTDTGQEQDTARGDTDIAGDDSLTTADVRGGDTEVQYYCEDCGAAVASDDQYCAHCGTELEHVVDTQNVE